MVIPWWERPRIMRKSSIFRIATTLTWLHEGYQVGILIPPKVGNFTPPLTGEKHQDPLAIPSIEFMGLLYCRKNIDIDDLTFDIDSIKYRIRSANMHAVDRGVQG